MPFVAFGSELYPDVTTSNTARTVVSQTSTTAAHDSRLAEKKAVITILERRLKERKTLKSALHILEGDLMNIEDILYDFHQTASVALDGIESEMLARLSIPSAKATTTVATGATGATSTTSTTTTDTSGTTGTTSATGTTDATSHKADAKPAARRKSPGEASVSMRAVGRPPSASPSEGSHSSEDTTSSPYSFELTSEPSTTTNTSKSSASSIPAGSVAASQPELASIVRRLANVEQSLSRIESKINVAAPAESASSNKLPKIPKKAAYAGISELDFFYDQAIEHLKRALDPLNMLTQIPICNSSKGIRTREDLFEHILEIKQLISKLTYSKVKYAGRREEAKEEE